MVVWRLYALVQNSYYARGLVCYMWVSCFMCVSCLLHVLHHVMSMPGRRNVCVGASRAVYLFCKVCAAGNLAEFWRKSQGTEWYNQHPVVASQPNPNLRIPIGQHGDDAGVYNNEKFPGKHFSCSMQFIFHTSGTNSQTYVVSPGTRY